MWAAPVAPPRLPVVAEHGEVQLKAPLPTVLVDTREQNPFSFARFRGWFAAIERTTLKLGDYSLAGLEAQCTIERKDLNDLVHSFTTERLAFVSRLKQMSRLPHRLVLITAPLSQVKSRYPHSAANPNQITQSLVAMLAAWACRSSAQRRTSWVKKLSLRFSIRSSFMTGWRKNDYARSLTDDNL
jgi:ERCC4-type nuclease